MIKNIISSDRKIRIAIAGCGRISQKHFESIETHADQLDLVSVCDIDANVLSANNKKHHLPTYLNLKEVSLVTNSVFDMMTKKTANAFFELWMTATNYALEKKIMKRQLCITVETKSTNMELEI